MYWAIDERDVTARQYYIFGNNWWESYRKWWRCRAPFCRSAVLPFCRCARSHIEFFNLVSEVKYKWSPELITNSRPSPFIFKFNINNFLHVINLIMPACVNWKLKTENFTYLVNRCSTQISLGCSDQMFDFVCSSLLNLLNEFGASPLNTYAFLIVQYFCLPL